MTGKKKDSSNIFGSPLSNDMNGLFGLPRKGPKTVKGQVNKWMTGDGRRNFENLSKDEQVDCLVGFGWLVKEKNKKSASKRKRWLLHTISSIFPVEVNTPFNFWFFHGKYRLQTDGQDMFDNVLKPTLFS